MGSRRVKVGQMASAISGMLSEYSEATSQGVKRAVADAAKTVRDETRSQAPRESGAYAKSWSAKTTKETATALEVTVHSRNRYQLAHLLEFGHAKRGGGRTRARPHIAPAEKAGVEKLERDIREAVRRA